MYCTLESLYPVVYVSEIQEKQAKPKVKRLRLLSTQSQGEINNLVEESGIADICI